MQKAVFKIKAQTMRVRRKQYPDSLLSLEDENKMEKNTTTPKKENSKNKNKTGGETKT